jgi:hypothetical protein
MTAGMIGERQLSSRRYWIGEISKLSGDFNADSAKVQEELTQELVNDGADALIGHLRLCGAIPEQYDHDSSEEKLYSKYTDVVISKAFQAIGLTSWVLSERSDAADVECVAEHYSFVADAKAFRLSRTAKNQKDFKVEAMDSWKKGKPYAVVVCPIYQLPSRTSQIYQQATSRSVCLFSYTHLAVLARYAGVDSQERAVELLHEVFRTVDAMNPSKDATGYWQALNRRIIDFDAKLSQIWSEEKIASSESVRLAKEEALRYFASERERIMRLSKEEAIEEVLRASKIENKVMAAKSVTDNTLLAVE